MCRRHGILERRMKISLKKHRMSEETLDFLKIYLKSGDKI